MKTKALKLPFAAPGKTPPDFLGMRVPSFKVSSSNGANPEWFIEQESPALEDSPVIQCSRLNSLSSPALFTANPPTIPPSYG